MKSSISWIECLSSARSHRVQLHRLVERVLRLRISAKAYENGVIGLLEVALGIDRGTAALGRG